MIRHWLRCWACAILGSVRQDRSFGVMTGYRVANPFRSRKRPYGGAFFICMELSSVPTCG